MNLEITLEEKRVLERLVEKEMDDETDSPARVKLLARLLLKMHKLDAGGW